MIFSLYLVLFFLFCSVFFLCSGQFVIAVYNKNNNNNKTVIFFKKTKIPRGSISWPKTSPQIRLSPTMQMRFLYICFIDRFIQAQENIEQKSFVLAIGETRASNFQNFLWQGGRGLSDLLNVSTIRTSGCVKKIWLA